MRISRRALAIAGLVTLAVCAVVTIVLVWRRLRRVRREGYANGQLRVNTMVRPFGAAFTPDGKHLVVGGSKVMVYSMADPAQPALVRTAGFENNKSVKGMAISRDGQWLALALGDGFEVWSLPKLLASKDGDADTSFKTKFVKTVVDKTLLDAGKRTPETLDVGFSPDDKMLAASHEYMRSVDVYDLQKLLANKPGANGNPGFVASIKTGAHPVGVTFTKEATGAQRLLFTTQTARKGDKCSGTLTVAELPSAKVLKVLDAGCVPVRAAVSNGFTYVTSRFDNSVLVFDNAKFTTGNALVAKIPVGPAPVGVAAAMGGAKLVVACSNRFSPQVGEINIIDTATKQVTHKLPAQRFPRNVAVTPDGRIAVIPNHKSASLEFVDLTALPAPSTKVT